MPFCQLVIGPPGAGKTTYCFGMHQFLTGISRECAIVNLDPANDSLPYEPAIDVSDLVSLETVMEKEELGPNGGLIYCLEYLEENFDWLEEKLKALQDKYILFDCPGQVEIFTHHPSLKNIIKRLEKLNYRMTAVHLVDAHYCTEPSKYISVLLVTLSTMVQLELPHVNVLSKIDLVEQFGNLDFNLEYYTDVQDLKYLLKRLNKETGPAFRSMNKALCGIVEDFSLVSFTTLNIQDKESVYELLKAIDKSNGYVYGSLKADNYSIMQVAVQESATSYSKLYDVQERYEKPAEQ